MQNWFASVAGHHGIIPTRSEPNPPPFVEEFIKTQDCAARQEWIQELAHIFLEPAGVSFADIPLKYPPILLAGFCGVCDWLGSNRDYFEFQENGTSLKDYFVTRKRKALEILKDFGLLSHINTKGGMEAIYPEYIPQNIQVLIDKLFLQQLLVIIEDNTGSGKTEASLAYASKLLAQDLGTTENKAQCYYGLTFNYNSQIFLMLLGSNSDCINFHIVQR